MDKGRRKWVTMNPYNVSVSSDGLVKSRHGNQIVTRQLSDGTPYVLLMVNGTKQELPVDVLVAFTWLGKPPGEGFQVAHRNGDIADCRAENLTWVADPDYWFEFYRELMKPPAWFAPGLRTTHR